MFTNADVADYYNTTFNHYARWWNLKRSLSVHYGIWNNKVNSFAESLIETNRIMMEHAEIKPGEKVLDAGCGVGGAAFFLHEQKQAEVKGISLSQKQITKALKVCAELGFDNHVSFELMDYANTTFKDNSFDVVWACESACHALSKKDFIKEAFRLLKKNGRLILMDFFPSTKRDKNNWLKKWGDTWSIPEFISETKFIQHLKDSGFCLLETKDYSNAITKSSKRMYCAALLGAIPSEIYNFFNPNVSHFARIHYKCGIYQYKALKAKLWRYKLLLAIK